MNPLAWGRIGDFHHLYENIKSIWELALDFYLTIDKGSSYLSIRKSTKLYNKVMKIFNPSSNSTLGFYGGLREGKGFEF